MSRLRQPSSWPKAAVHEMLGMPFSSADGDLSKEGLVLYLAALLCSDAHRDAAQSFLASNVHVTVDLSGTTPPSALPSTPEPAALPPLVIPAAGDAEGDGEIVVEPAWRSDKYLRRLRSPRKRQKRAPPEEDPARWEQLGEIQRGYAMACQEVLVAGELRDPEMCGAVGPPPEGFANPRCNRSVLTKLGSITRDTDTVDMSEHLLGNHGVLPLLLTLRLMPRLTSLNLSRNDIRVEAVQSLRKLVADMPTLKYIDLSYNRFLCASAGRELLAMVKETHPQLQQLRLDGSSVPAHYVKSIAALAESAARGQAGAE
eukprot:TRINITY_DN69931_c0_g1_i1.p1 TRINITY_DN69931_c0_g1~~TRINITY_DN69931_c0_g1_i1.p1  ORF type:complete len:338 (+),score=104.25 TRINITY_DN69931_c0_g1_i1:75-1016(+)